MHRLRPKPLPPPASPRLTPGQMLKAWAGGIGLALLIPIPIVVIGVPIALGARLIAGVLPLLLGLFG